MYFAIIDSDGFTVGQSGVLPEGSIELTHEQYSELVSGVKTMGAEGSLIDYIAPSVPTPSPVPQTVSYFQGCAALMQAGFLDDVEAYMLTADAFEQIAWKTITEMRRNSPMTKKLGTLLGMTDVMMDDLFRFADTISA